MTSSILRRATPGVVRDLNALLPQLSRSPKPLTLHDVRAIVRDFNAFLLVLRDKNRIVGMGMLCLMHTPTRLRSRIEDVVVDEGYRGRGLGERLTKELIALAKRKKAMSIELSSRPERVAANALYRKLAFEQKETNVYRLKLR